MLETETLTFCLGELDSSFIGLTIRQKHDVNNNDLNRIEFALDIYAL